MELVKKVGETTIYKKKSGRFGVQNNKNKWINGDEKAKILSEAGLIKVSVKAKVEAVAEAPAEVAEESTEA
jgi:hypothetical protein